MSTGVVATFSLILLLALILCGVHLSTSLMFTSVLSVYLTTGRFSTAMNVLSQSAWGAVRQYMFGVIPLFVLMGLLANLSGASKDLYDSASLLLKKVRGGVAIATVVANAIFAAITGVTVASAAVFTKIALPQMTRLKYNRKIALGTISGSAILGMLIPPSLLMIVYGSQADVSIGKLFVAAVVPGVIMTIAFIVVILIIGRIRPEYIPETESLTEEEKKDFWRIVLKPWPIVVLIIISLGCILDSTSILLLTTPLMCPIIADLGYDLVWFGLVMIIAIETGMITPPFGMNVFTVKSSLYGMEGMEDITVGEIFSGSTWFLIAIIVVDLICIFIPQVVTFLPGAM